MKKVLAYLLCVLGVTGAACLVSFTSAKAAPSISTPIEKIYIVSQTYMDAIVLQSEDENGQPIFGIVDSGQGSTWPDGTDPRYPDRPGITKYGSIQDMFLAYLTQLGVTQDNLLFYLGTHPHSDHIGTASAVIRQFKPKRVYAEPYRDSLIKIDARLWDNLFQYDQLRKAAADVGATFIQYFDTQAYVDPVRDPAVPEAPTKTTTLDGMTIKAYIANPTFMLGSLKLDVMHYMDVDGAPDSIINDANELSLGVKVTSSTTNQTAFLAGDIDNYASAYAPANQAETQLAKKLGHIDFLKLGHHGLDGSNTEEYLKALAPKSAFVTGEFNLMPERTYSTLAALGTHLYQAPESQADGHTSCIVDLSTVANGGPALIDTGNAANEPHIRIASDGAHHLWYYADGLPKSTSGLIKDGDTWGYFPNQAYALQSEWVKQSDGLLYANDQGLIMHNQWCWAQDSQGCHWFYFDPAGHVTRNTWVIDQTTHKIYYVNQSGYMLTGWQWVDNAWHYFHPSSGDLFTGWQNIDNAVYLLEGEHGNMLLGGWFWRDNAWRYFASSGAAALGWAWIDDSWYYLDPTSWGAMLHGGWTNLSGTWYYLADSGKMLTNWQWIGSFWFYLGPDGAMRVSWQWIDTAYYFFDTSGHMVTGWFIDNGYWYYCYSNGAMAHDCWIDGYWINSDGTMA